MGGWEFDRWCQYWVEEPWGTWRDNMHSAVLTAAVVNSQPGRKRAVKPADFMLRLSEDVKAEKTRNTLAAMRAMARGRPR